MVFRLRCGKDFHDQLFWSSVLIDQAWQEDNSYGKDTEGLNDCGRGFGMRLVCIKVDWVGRYYHIVHKLLFLYTHDAGFHVLRGSDC